MKDSLFTYLMIANCVYNISLSYLYLTGRYGEEFIEKRCEKLQMWTNRIARHPILSRSDVVHHFLTCPDGDEKVQ